MVNRRSNDRGRSGVPRQTTPRHVWLAALGAAAVARRATLAALGETAGLRREALRFAGDIRDVAFGAALTVQEKIGRRIEPQVAHFGAGVEARLAPVLDRLGVKPARKSARKPARKARRTTAKKPARSGAGARKKAATRVARKGRG